MAGILLRHLKARWQTGLRIWLKRGSKKYICCHILWKKTSSNSIFICKLPHFKTNNNNKHKLHTSIYQSKIMSGILNKVKSAVSGDHQNSTTHSTTTTTHHGAAGHNTSLPEGTVGSHNSRVANAADPRIDSDLDSSRHTGLGSSTHNQTSHNPLSSTHGTSTQSHNPLSTSNHAHSHGTGVGGTPYNTTGGSSHQSHIPATGNHGQTTAGVHNSNRRSPNIALYLALLIFRCSAQQGRSNHRQ